MASIQQTKHIFVEPRVEPRSVESTKKQRKRRHRLLKAIILLTVPFYCAGFSMLAMLQVDAVMSRAASSPLFLGGLGIFALLLLMEPFTGAVTNSCAVGAKFAGLGLADPMSCLTVAGGCLTVVSVASGVVALAAWLVL